MKIRRVLAVPIRSGFYVDDQAAILAGAVHDGFDYVGTPLTPGFKSIRQAGVALSIVFILEDGQVAYGDCVVVQYSGVGGREALFDSDCALEIVNKHISPLLTGREVTDFKSLANEVDNFEVEGQKIPASIRYGATQGILDLVAKVRGITMAEVIQDEYKTGIEIRPIPIFAQTGDDRFINVDKMILKEVDIIPHGLINNVETKLGLRGKIFKEYVSWVKNRILEIRKNDKYHPILQFDVYGTIGQIFNSDISLCVDYLVELSRVASPFTLRIEHVIDGGSVEEQIKISKALKDSLRERGSTVELSVDEWCNTLEDIKRFVDAKAAHVIHIKTPDLGGINNVIEALLLVRRADLGGYCGGTCNETEKSAQVSAHIAMACGALQILAKPGMGVDEGLMIVGNEMARVSALVASRRTKETDVTQI